MPSQTVLLQAFPSATATGVRWYKDGILFSTTAGNQIAVGFADLGNYFAEAINIEGCIARSQTIVVKARGGLAPKDEGINVALYPNPATNIVNAYFDNPINQTVTARLVNMVGQELRTKTVSFTKRFQITQFNVADLRPDVYAIEFISSKGFTIARNLFVKGK